MEQNGLGRDNNFGVMQVLKLTASKQAHVDE